MEYFDPLRAPFWVTVAYALACGCIVGLERQLRGKPVGVRTSMLICLGTAIFISLGASAGDGTGDPARVLGQVVTGVGFIGAGVIISNAGVVVGVTTAAVIWLLAAVGSAIGLGYHLGALALSLVTVAVLVVVGLVESAARRLASRHRRTSGESATSN